MMNKELVKDIQNLIDKHKLKTCSIGFVDKDDELETGYFSSEGSRLVDIRTLNTNLIPRLKKSSNIIMENVMKGSGIECNFHSRDLPNNIEDMISVLYQAAEYSTYVKEDSSCYVLHTNIGESILIRYDDFRVDATSANLSYAINDYTEKGKILLLIQLLVGQQVDIGTDVRPNRIYLI